MTRVYVQVQNALGGISEHRLIEERIVPRGIPFCGGHEYTP